MLVKAVSPPELHAAYTTGRCPVCSLTDRDERRYIDIALYEQVTNVPWRAQIRNARGFCTPHTTRIIDEGRSALGVALIAEDLLKTLGEILPTGLAPSPGTFGRLLGALGSGVGAVAGRLRPAQRCPICAHLLLQVPVHVRSMLQDLLEPEGQRVYAGSAGLCVAHLVQTLEIADPSGAIPYLVEHQRRVWEGLLGELAEFIRKSDYQYAGEPIGEEGGAWRRAFRLLSGWQAGQHLR